MSPKVFRKLTHSPLELVAKSHCHEFTKPVKERVWLLETPKTRQVLTRNMPSVRDQSKGRSGLAIVLLEVTHTNASTNCLMSVLTFRGGGLRGRVGQRAREIGYPGIADFYSLSRRSSKTMVEKIDTASFFFFFLPFLVLLHIIF